MVGSMSSSTVTNGIDGIADGFHGPAQELASEFLDVGRIKAQATMSFVEATRERKRTIVAIEAHLSPFCCIEDVDLQGRRFPPELHRLNWFARPSVAPHSTHLLGQLIDTDEPLVIFPIDCHMHPRASPQ